jgi:MFS family permease
MSEGFSETNVCGRFAARLWTKQLAYAAVIMLGALNFGFNVGFGTPAITDLHLQSTFWFGTVIYITAVPGAVTAAAVLRFIGRRTFTFLCAAIATFFWLLFFAVKENTSEIYPLVIRALCGFVIGATSVVIPMYLVEISPPESTGFYGTLNQVAISFGIVFCDLIALVTGKPGFYLLTGVGALICLILAIAIWFIPESPAITEVNPNLIVGADNTTLWSRRWLWPMATVILLMLFQQTTGINVILNSLDQIVLSRTATWTIGSGVAQVVGNFIGAFFIEYLGRRAVWVISSAGVAITELVWAIYLASVESNHGTMEVVQGVLLGLFLFAFGLGGGPIPWFLVPETFPVGVRPIAGSLVSVANWSFAFASMFIRIQSADLVQQFPFYFVVAALSLGGTVFGLFYIKNPEIQAREELHPDIFRIPLND